MKKTIAFIIITIISITLFPGCDAGPVTGSVFEDHPGVDYDDGSGITDPMDGMNLYFGNLHSHTGYSDGEGSAEEAFRWARDTAGYDFYAITDHAISISSGEWDEIGHQANAFTAPGLFLAIRGFEWSHLIDGHVCVYNTSDYTNSVITAGISSLSDWIDDNDGFAQYNHPGRESGKFNDFSYSSQCADNVFAIETGNKDDGNIGNEFLPYYVEALSMGWRMAPTSSQDNHSLSTNSHRTVVIAPDLTMDELFSAMEERRIYSSDDPDMSVIYKIGAHWMGSVVNIPAGYYRFLIIVEDNEPINSIQLINGSDGSVAAENTVAGGSTAITWKPGLTISRDIYFFVKITGSDTRNDDPSYSEQVTVTAPIWLNVL